VRKKALLLLAALIVAGLAVFALRPVPVPALSPSELAMFEPMKTYCFGRYQVDIPAKAVLEANGNSFLLGKINTGFGVPTYRELLKETLEKLKNKEDRYEYVKSEYPEDSYKQIIIRRVDLFGEMSYGVDAFTLNPRGIPGGGYFFYLSEGSYDENRMDEIVSDYRKILNSVRYRPDSEIPKEPGFCFVDGFVADDGKTSQNEESNLAFKLKDYPDVWVRIESVTYHVKEKSLLERASPGALDSLLPGKKVTVISRKKREINGIDGEELLVSAPSRDGTGIDYVFTWETLGELSDPLKPCVQLEITTGEQHAGGSSLTTSQIRALYEAIVKTIRIRPVTENPSDGKAKPESSPPAPKPEAQAPQASPLRLATGEPCTRTGMWRCVEDGKVVTYHEGRFMPTAYFFKPATGWLNRLKGVKSVFSHQGPGHWEWVGELPETDAKKG